MSELLAALTAAQAAGMVARGEVTVRDYAAACLDRIADIDGEIGAFIHLDRDHVLEQAKALDEQRASGHPIGPLHGIPVAIKDIIDTADYPTEYGSAITANRRPYRDATVVARLRAAGALIIGKTVTTEFAYFHPGKTRNPHDTERTPGGSSSGSAAAVAASMVPLAVGTQTNGSIIRPGSFCGVFAFKPSHGLVSRHGILPLSRTLDHVGPLARTLEDIGLVLNAMAGYDPEDPDTRPVASGDFRKAAGELLQLAPRFAFVRTPVWDKADAATKSAFEAFAKMLGTACYTLDLPDRYVQAWDTHRSIMVAEMAHNLGAIADRHGERVSKILRDLIVEGRQVTATRYLAAAREAQSFKASLTELFDECNAIITPASIGVAPKSLDSTGNPVFCSLWTLAGLPSITLPLLEGEDGMPLGVQVVGAPGHDERLLRTAHWLMQNLGTKQSF